jgi:multidrug efflux pump subunit AcrA (membrane-fusion protein)
MSGSKKRRVRKYVVVGFIVVLIIAGFFAWRGLRSTSNGEITYRTQAVQKMTLTSSVSGVGNIFLSSSASVNPGISGTVSGLAVKVGDAVKEGRLLFTVVNDQLDLDVVNAQNSYNNAVAAVDRAQLSVLQAEQSLTNLKKQKADQATSTTTTLVPSTVTSFPSTTTSFNPPTTVTSSTLPATTTTVPVTTTTTLPPSTTSSAGSLGTQGQGATLAAAAATQPAQTGGQTTVSTITALDIEVAQAQVTSAELSVTTAQAQVESASLQLQQAKDTAAKRRVVASMDGVVTQVNVQNGDSLGSTGSSQGGGQTAGGSSSTSSTAPIVITNTNALEVTVSVAESDVVSVKVGQKATLTFDALPDLTLTGKVTAIDNSGTVNQGVVSYNVTLVPDATDPSVKGGMTVTASIITDVRADVLAAPNAAVKTSTSGSYVQILENGAPVDQTVEVGISTDSYTEITSGLTEGQEVITQTVNPNASTSTTVRGNQGGPGGGFGVPGGGGGIPGF